MNHLRNFGIRFGEHKLRKHKPPRARGTGGKTCFANKQCLSKSSCQAAKVWHFSMFVLAAVAWTVENRNWDQTLVQSLTESEGRRLRNLQNFVKIQFRGQKCPWLANHGRETPVRTEGIPPATLNLRIASMLAQKIVLKTYRFWIFSAGSTGSRNLEFPVKYCAQEATLYPFQKIAEFRLKISQIFGVKHHQLRAPKLATFLLKKVSTLSSKLCAKHALRMLQESAQTCASFCCFAASKNRLLQAQKLYFVAPFGKYQTFENLTRFWG